MGRVDMKEGGGETLRGGNGEGETGRGNGEREMRKKKTGGRDGEDVNREGEMGRGAMGRGEGEGGGIREEGKEVRQAHGMPGWNKVTVCSDLAYPCNAGYPS